MLKGILYSFALVVSALVFAKSRSRTLRQSVLLIASYAAYMTWGLWFATVLFASTVMNFFFGEWLRRKTSGLRLSAGILLNLLLLGSFKFLAEATFHLPFASMERFSRVALPLGISFWTFQAMSYLFDLYRGEELDPSFFEFALYMAFFPVAISGPICRMPDLLPQFRSEKLTSWDSIGQGLGRMATGVLMMQLAKLLGQGILGGDGITSGFDHVTHWGGTDVWCLAIGYGLQLFFDFAGYSHIAIGAAQALGIGVPENFQKPFLSTSPSIFWTRWHMSLSFWIRDYVFLPLAMLRREVWWRNFVLVISMVLFGLWHKASVLFVLWGCYHGVLLVLHRQVQGLCRTFRWEPPAAFWEPLSWLATMALVSLGWVMFRASSLGQARGMLLVAFSPTSYSARFLSGSLYILVLGLGLGYAIVLWIGKEIEAHASEETADSKGAMAFIARWRWYWLPPLYVVTLLFVFIVTAGDGASTAQLMYRGF